MALSPLARRIYVLLVERLRLRDPLLSYGDLVQLLRHLLPPNTDLKPNDPRLFEALGEVSLACQNHDPSLPSLTSLVVRRQKDGSLGMPGDGYFAVNFPRVRDERARQQTWRREIERVRASAYPEDIASPEASPPERPQNVPSWIREPTIIAALIGLVGTLITVVISVWIASRHDEVPTPRPPDRPPSGGARKPPEPAPSPPQVPPGNPPQPTKPTLDGILAILERHHQRATFSAVAGLLGVDPTYLFRGYPRTPRTNTVRHEI